MLRKIALYFCSVLILVFIGISNQIPVFFGYSNNFEIYTKNPSSNAVIVQANSNEYRLISNKVGESCKIKGKFDLSSFLQEMGAKVVLSEKTAQGVSYYAYSDDIKYGATIYGKAVNLHVFIGDTGVTVGSPLIFGSF